MEANQGRLGSQRGQQFGTGTQWGVPHCISTYWHPLRWTGNASSVPSCVGGRTDAHTETCVTSNITEVSG